MVMASEKTNMHYYERAKELRKLFWLNIDIAKTELVVKGSLVDFNTYQLICDTYECIISVRSFISQFKFMAMRKDGSNEEHKKDAKLIEEFNKIEERFDIQTLFLENLRSTPKANARPFEPSLT